MSQASSTDTTDVALIDSNAMVVYCHHLARIDKLGPNRQLIFTLPSIQDPGYHEVQIKLIMPAELMATLAYMAINADQAVISRELIALVPGTAN